MKSSNHEADHIIDNLKESSRNFTTNCYRGKREREEGREGGGERKREGEGGGREREARKIHLVFIIIILKK